MGHDAMPLGQRDRAEGWMEHVSVKPQRAGSLCLVVGSGDPAEGNEIRANMGRQASRCRRLSI